MNRSLRIFRPEPPVTFPLLPRPSEHFIHISFPGIERVGIDSSLMIPCSFLTASATFSQKEVNESSWTLSEILGWRLSHAKHILPLGAQHAWDLCKRQSAISLLNEGMSGIRRIWFLGLYLYEEYKELTPKEGDKKATGTGGGEYCPVMVRDYDRAPWAVQLAPSCDFHSDDRVAFGESL